MNLKCRNESSFSDKHEPNLKQEFVNLCVADMKQSMWWVKCFGLEGDFMVLGHFEYSMSTQQYEISC